MHKNAIGGHTNLTAHKKLEPNELIHRKIQIRVWQDDKRGIPP
jgi:hypothetical protein